MGRVVLLVVVLLGSSSITCGIASLTGRWMGTPPWWLRPAPKLSFHEWCERERIQVSYWSTGPSGSNIFERDRWRKLQTVIARDGRGGISGAIISVGVGLAAVGAWPRRRRKVAL